MVAEEYRQADISIDANKTLGYLTPSFLAFAQGGEEMGVNMFNFSFNHTMKEIRDLAGPEVVLVGNVPPRDVVANGTPQQVEEAVKKAFDEIPDHDRIIWSVGGGMAPEVKDVNLNAFIRTVKTYSK